MTEHLDAALDGESLSPNTLLVQNTTSNTGGTARDLRIDYESDNDSEKPILLELGVSSNNAPTSATELTSVPYASNYPLDIHLNSVYVPSMPIHLRNYSTDPALLYNNPYNNGILTTTPQFSLHTSPHSAEPSNNAAYSSHIPQTVYTWSTSPPLRSTTPTEVNKLPIEIVPPSVYMSYSNTRKHTISKQVNPSWKEKALQTEKDSKKTACDRERTRMRDMNRAFDILRSKLPISKPNGKKYSKIESLRIAINYIKHLQKMLKEHHMGPHAKYLCDYNVR